MAEILGGRRTVYRTTRVKVEFKLNRTYFKELAVGRKLRRAVGETVRVHALPFAVSISPRSTEHHQHYQDSFVVIDGLTGTVPHDLIIGHPPMLRVMTRLMNVSGHAAAVEWGNARTPRGHHVLRKTLEHLSAIPHETNRRGGI